MKTCGYVLLIFTSIFALIALCGLYSGAQREALLMIVHPGLVCGGLSAAFILAADNLDKRIDSASLNERIGQ